MRQLVVGLSLLLVSSMAGAQLIPYAGGGLGNGAPCAEAVVNPAQVSASSIGILFAELIGAQARWCGVGGTVRRIAQLDAGAVGIARDDTTGTTYVSTTTGALLGFNANGVQTATIPGVSQPTQLAVGGGSLWVADKADAVWRVGLPCVACVPQKVLGAEWVTQPQGITYDGGTLYVSDTGGGRVLTRTATGEVSVVATATNPLGLAVSTDGSLFIAEGTLNRVRRVVGGTSTVVATMTTPTGLAVKLMALPSQVTAHEYLFVGSPVAARIAAVDIASLPAPVATATHPPAPTQTAMLTSTATHTATTVPTSTATRLPTCMATATVVPTGTPQSQCVP